MKVLVIIPARGGSKGVPKKNIKLLGDKPLVAYAIDCAKNAKKVARIIVSTDSQEIATIAKLYNCDYNIRPQELAEDTSNVVTAVEYVYNQLNEDFDVLLLLQPTSPFRTSNDLDEIISLLEENNAIDGVISVVPMDDMHPARMYNLSNENQLASYVEDGETKRRQDLKPIYYRNGCFYAVRTKAFFQEKSFMVKNKMAYIMKPEWLVNIDTPRDFRIAELLLEEWKNENINN
ncbi:acylneuraminate cytidylyltransferase family protein [Flavobacterium sp.]